MKREIQKARRTRAVALRNYEDVVRMVQCECEHRRLAEARWENLNYSSLPPMRVCLNCGITEEGWGCGYVVLKGTARHIDRELLYAIRCGYFVADDDKGPLLRGETTIQDLIRKGRSQ